ncbi:hypothetical protein J9303_15905 [Bacillaceae bacterium Marseille-Q3522]|nr:hypothetical protein [Bacillaceae bacterium Marseille-Q3522]
MNAIHSDQLKNTLQHIIKEKAKLGECKELLLKYVDYQADKGFPFGEILILHYQMFNGRETNEIYTGRKSGERKGWQ